MLHLEVKLHETSFLDVFTYKIKKNIFFFIKLRSFVFNNVYTRRKIRNLQNILNKLRKLDLVISVLLLYLFSYFCITSIIPVKKSCSKRVKETMVSRVGNYTTWDC